MPVTIKPPPPPRLNGAATSSEQVVAQVTQKLGRVPRHVVTKAIHLWGQNYRVNVYCEIGHGIVRTNNITHSFFVTTSKHGVITKSRPEITQ